MLIHGLVGLACTSAIAFVGVVCGVFFHLDAGLVRLSLLAVRVFVTSTVLWLLIFVVYMLYQFVSLSLTGDTFQISIPLLRYFYKTEKPGLLKDIFFTLLVTLTSVLLFAIIGAATSVFSP